MDRLNPFTRCGAKGISNDTQVVFEIQHFPGKITRCKSQNSSTPSFFKEGGTKGQKV